jgi:hypothetical protein
MAQAPYVAGLAGEERRAMRTTLLQSYQRARSRIRVDEQHRKRVRTFIVYVLFVLLLLTILVQTTGFSLSQLWLKTGAKQDKDKDIASTNMSQVVIPLPDNVTCRYVWHDRQTMQIRKSITGPCNKDNKPPETKFAPPRNDFSWGDGRK